jgi:hypothetical protein
MRILLLLVSCLSAAVFTPVWADAGLVQTYAITNVDASGNTSRAGGFNSDGGQSFQGANLGTAQASIYLNGGEVKTYKNDGADVTAAHMFYRLYQQGITPGDFIQIDLPFGSDLGNGNQKWARSDAAINIASGLGPGNYVLEVYWRIDGTFGFSFDSNGGQNYKATYTVTSTTLPVSLIDFSVKTIQKQVVANWSTASERNNARFDLERSSDALTFESIARLDGHGTTTTRQAYSAIDESPRLGVNYYRLRQTDVDGKFSYSPLRSAIIRTNGEIVLTGQPANEVLSIDGLEEASQVDISTIQGRSLYRQKSSGSQTKIDVGNWPSGLYLLRVADQLGVQVQRVVVQH